MALAVFLKPLALSQSYLLHKPLGESEMRQARTLALTMFACVAVGVTTTAVAAAEKPEISPVVKSTINATGGTSMLEQKEGIAAATGNSAEATFLFENAKEGKFDLLILEYSVPLGGKCTGLDDEVRGSVLLKGKFKMGYLDAPKTKPGMALKLNPEVHFECEKLISLTTVRGTLICELTPFNVDTLETKLLCKQGKGVNQFVQILNATNTAFENGILESEINGGAFKQSGFSIHLALTGKELAIILA